MLRAAAAIRSATTTSAAGRALRTSSIKRPRSCPRTLCQAVSHLSQAGGAVLAGGGPARLGGWKEHWVSLLKASSTGATRSQQPPPHHLAVSSLPRRNNGSMPGLNGDSGSVSGLDLQTQPGDDFGDGAFQPQALVTVHGASNLAEGLRAKVIAYDLNTGLYVIKDAEGKIWGLSSDKLRPMLTMEMTDEWQDVPEGATLPGGVEVRLDLDTGRRQARLRQEGGAEGAPTAD